jgi:prophage DNA circulation protein
MSILSGFQRTTLGGVEGYFQADQMVNLGRKTVSHNFVNSKSRYVEDLGPSPNVFKIKWRIIESTFSAYKSKRDKLEAVLNTAGIITFIHPTRGKLKVVATQNGEAINPLSALNVIEYDLTLEIADKNIFPTSAGGNKNFLNRIYDSINDTSGGALAQAVSFYNEGIAVFNDARDSIQDITGTINDVVSTINGVADEVAAFVSDIAAFQASITNLMQTPADLASRMNQIYGNVAVITNNFGDLLKVSLALVGAGTKRGTKIGTSSRTQTINNNKNALYNFNDVAALNIAYLASTNIAYTDQSQLAQTQKLLDDAFLSLDPDTVNEDVYNLMQSMRAQNRLYLDTLRLSLPLIVTQVIINSLPSTVLAYQLYGSSTRASEIVLLNNLEDPAYVRGVINVLSN